MERAELGTLVEGGVLLTSRAVAAGWSRVQLHRKLVPEGWTRVQTGVWVEPGRQVDAVVRLKAAQLIRPPLVVSHGSAARLWWIEILNARDGGQGPVADLQFTDPECRRRPNIPGLRIHRLPLPEAEVVRRSGLRVTDVSRTLADLLRAGPRDVALVAVESALGFRTVRGVRRSPLTTLAALSLALEAPLLGAVRARDWLALADPRAGSPAETMARLHMCDAGLRPETQAEVRAPGCRRRYLDFLFRAEALAVEIEGYAYHGTREAHRRDVARFNEILRCPEVRTLLRYTAEDVFRRPAWMIGEIRTALGAARAPG